MTTTFNAISCRDPRAAPRAVAAALAGLALLGCDRGEPAAQSPSARQSAADERSASATAAAPTRPPRADPNAAPAPRTAVDDGKIPFDYPAVSLSAAAGSYVLAPPREWIEQAFERGAETQTFVYYGAWLREPGPRTSRIEYLTEQKAVLPNSMIIAIRRGARAKPGDIVLTSWASGAALQRAIVVDGGTPERPRVRYLDLGLESPSGWGKKADTLREHSFHPLRTPGEIGTSVACKDGARQTHWIITHRAGEKLLALGFAGKLRVFDSNECRPLPLVPRLAWGQDAMVPVLGAFVPAKVRRFEPQIGRVFVLVRSGGKEEERAPSFTNVAESLD